MLQLCNDNINTNVFNNNNSNNGGGNNSRVVCDIDPALMYVSWFLNNTIVPSLSLSLSFSDFIMFIK